MKKLLFINACIRGEESKTLQLANVMLETLKKRYDITTIDLTTQNLQCISPDAYHERKSQGPSSEDIKNSKMVATADRIVVAAPFWDMSFPSLLKVFIERVSLYDITFGNNEDGSTHGKCIAEKMLYITTRGMNIETKSKLDQGTSYLEAVCWLWGIPEVVTVSVSGTDMCDEATLLSKMECAKTKGISICNEF